MLKDLSVDQFVREVASASPAPGGGSVAALAGAQAAALLSMYCHLSLNREKFGEAVGLIERTAEEAHALAAALVEAVDLDTAAFNRVMEAFRLPKGIPEEKEQRSRDIQTATIEAARVPMQTAADCLRVLELIKAVAGRGNPGAATDLGVGNLQGLAGLTGACYNVLINLGSIKDCAVKTELAQKVTEALEQGRALFEKNRSQIEGSIGTVLLLP
ncbi:MAG: cyclodeaminase/cyclohydrolase family protein [Bacillota bacterium]